MARDQYQVYVKPKAAKFLSTNTAVRGLNRELGFGAVDVVNSRRKADVVVGLGLGGAKRAGQFTERAGRDRIQINKSAKQLPRSAFRRVIEHELGHGLGLGHVKAPRNLMNPNTGGRNLRTPQRNKVRRTMTEGGYG